MSTTQTNIGRSTSSKGTKKKKNDASNSTSATTSTTSSSTGTSSMQSEPFAHLRRLLQCDNAACGQLNPTKRCSRCHGTYYCSVPCQQADWKSSGGGHRYVCQPIAEMQAAFVAQYALPPNMETIHTGDNNDKRNDTAASNNTDDPASSSNNNNTDHAACGICLDSDMAYPTVLPNCGHVFCFKCISDYQGNKNFVHESAHEYTRTARKDCPYCRVTMDAHVIVESTRLGNLLLKRGRWFVAHDNDDERAELFRRAMFEAKKVLQADSRDTAALYLKANLLERSDPKEAIATLRYMLELDRISAKHQKKIDAMYVAINAAVAAGQYDRVSQIGKEIEEYTAHPDHWPRRIEPSGNDHQRLWPIYLSMGRAYEAATQYKKAASAYFKVCGMDRPAFMGRVAYFDQDGDDENAYDLRAEAYFGLSRCLYHFGQYEAAIATVEVYLMDERTEMGVHKLVALPLLALMQQEQQQQEENVDTTNGTAKTTTRTTTQTETEFEISLDGVIKVMYQGLVYESQWHDNNKRANHTFLQELCDLKAKAAAAVSAPAAVTAATTSSP